MSRSSYICDPAICDHAESDGNARNGSGHCWHESAQRRLTQHYGVALANRIRDGRDPASNADIAAWNRLGTKRAVAA